MQRRLLTTLLILTVAVPVAVLAAVDEVVATSPVPDRDSIFRMIDAEMERWPEYVARRQRRIDSLTQEVQKQKSADEWYATCVALVREYSCFQNDSAIYYLTKLQETAPWTTDPEDVKRAAMMKAQQASRSGMYEAALEWLSEIDTTGCSTATRAEYERVRHFTFVEMSAYCYFWDKRAEYLEQAHQCRVMLMQLLPHDSAEWLLYKAYDELLADHFEQAEKDNLQSMARCEKYSSLYREAAFHHRFICEALNKKEEAIYWQAVCAISEIRLAMNDQIGLWSVAELLGHDELELSHRYSRFAWEAISHFGKNARKWDISPVLTSIEHRYQERKSFYYQVMTAGAVVLLLLTIALAASLWYVNRQRHHLSEARNRLAESNRQLLASNRRLTDANRTKEHYIVQLLSYNSDFIDQKEEERRTLSKLQRTGKEKELVRMLNAADKTGREHTQLLSRFDDIFLELYPTFIDDFNALLHEEKRIRLTRHERMNTPLRIFALMRLGIDNVQDVSTILNCSAQTVYNYRHNLKNAFTGERDDFEKTVKEIGLPDLVNE